MQDQNTPTGGRPSAPDAVWEAARADYLAGVSAVECARRHGVGATTLRTRAAAQGWRRKDQPWRPANQLDPDDEGVALEDSHEGDMEQIGYGDLAWVAERRMMRAVLRGDASSALRWDRVWRMMDAHQAEMDRWLAQDEALVAEHHALSLGMDSGDSGDSGACFSTPEP